MDTASKSPTEAAPEPPAEVVNPEPPLDTAPKPRGSRTPLIIALVAVLLAALGAGGYFITQAAAKKSVQAQEASLVQQAKDAIANQNPAAAEQAAQQALALTPAKYLVQSQAAVALRGQALAMQEKYAEAMPDLQAALALDPQNAALLALRGKAYLAAGEIPKAMEDFAASLKLDALQADLLELQALTAFDQGDLALARSAAAAAGKLDPSFGLPYAFEAQDLYARFAFTETIRLATQAIELRKPPAFAYTLRGGAEYWLFDLPAAQADLEKALALDPNDIEATALLALLASETDQVEDLKAAAERASLQAHKTVPGLLAQAAAALYDYQHAEARLLLDEAIALAPERPELYLLHSETYTSSLDEKTSIADVEKAAALAPHHRKVRFAQAQIALYLYELDKAWQIGQELVAAYPAGVDGYDILASVHFSRYELRQALEVAEQGLAAAGEHATLFNARGDVYQMLRQFDEATSDFEQALRLRPSSTYALISLAQIAEDRGEYTLAMERIEQALALDPNDAGLLLLRASVYEDQGKDDLASADRKQAEALDSGDRFVLLLKADDLVDEEEYFKAKSILEDLEERYPLWPDPKISRAGVLFAQEDLIAARKLLNEVLDAFPNHTSARLVKAYLELTESRPDLAQEEVDAILTIQPLNPYAHSLQGNIYMSQAEPDKAEASLLKALELDPQRYVDHAMLGMLHYQQGKYDQAIEDFQAALKGDENPTAAILLKTLQNLPEGFKPYYFPEDGFVISVPEDWQIEAGDPESNTICEFYPTAAGEDFVLGLYRFESMFGDTDMPALFSGMFHEFMLENNPTFTEGELVDFEGLNTEGVMNTYGLTNNGYRLVGNMYIFSTQGYNILIDATTLYGQLDKYAARFDQVAASFGFVE